MSVAAPRPRARSCPNRERLLTLAGRTNDSRSASRAPSSRATVAALVALRSARGQLDWCCIDPVDDLRGSLAAGRNRRLIPFLASLACLSTSLNAPAKRPEGSAQETRLIRRDGCVLLRQRGARPALRRQRAQLGRQLGLDLRIERLFVSPRLHGADSRRSIGGRAVRGELGAALQIDTARLVQPVVAPAARAGTAGRLDPEQLVVRLAAPH